MFKIQSNEIQYCDCVEIHKRDDSITLHLYCKSGREQQLYDQLPIWITKLGEVVIGVQQVFIRLK